MNDLISMQILLVLIILNLSSIKSNYWETQLPTPLQIKPIITIAVPLKSLYNFWRSIEMLLINCKIEIKLKWANYCFVCKWK